MTEDNNHIDRAVEFLEQTQRMGEQLRTAEDLQRQLLTRMIDLKKQKQTDSEEYLQLDQRSKALQVQIDKYRPIYLERLEVIKEVKARKHSSNKLIIN